MNEKVDVEIDHRKLTVGIEGITPIEINALARLVESKMKEIFRENPKIADSSKIAILAALSFAVENFKNEQARDAATRALENKVEHMSLALQGALSND
jgi:cell division protein ZapA (FtsZ GTPase activity inhibitor)